MPKEKPDPMPRRTPESYWHKIRRTKHYGNRKKTLEITAKVAKEARAALRPPVKKVKPSRLCSFDESADLLKKCKIDIRQARDDEVRNMIRWGLIDESKAEKYHASFENLQIPESDLRVIDLRRKTEPDFDPQVIFGIDNMTPEEAFQKLIIEAGIPVHIYKDHEFRNFNRIDVETGRKRISQKPTGKAGILIASNYQNLPSRFHISPEEHLTRMAQGKKYMGPVGWMKFLRQSIDRALPILSGDEKTDIYSLLPEEYKKLMQNILITNSQILEYVPDPNTGTQFADLRHKDRPNEIPYLQCFVDSGCGLIVGLQYRDQFCDSEKSVGCRPIHGTFVA